VAFLNKGLQRWDAMLEVPVLQSTWSVFCILGGGVFFEEFSGFELWQYFVFTLGAGVTLSGVVLLAYYRRQKKGRDGHRQVQLRAVVVGAHADGDQQHLGDAHVADLPSDAQRRVPRHSVAGVAREDKPSHSRPPIIPIVTLEAA
jgi:hypothetical protein